MNEMTVAMLKYLEVDLTLSDGGCQFPIGKPNYFYRAKKYDAKL